ncbi:MAG: hypothetical protein NVSMB25_05150 [Thermoleophilaceae bacterium]
MLPGRNVGRLVEPGDMHHDTLSNPVPPRGGPRLRSRAPRDRAPELGPLAAMLLRKSVDSLTHDRDRCSSCRRVPLAGELLHELESHRVVCQLCLGRLPESKRETVATQRVHVCDRPLSVVPRAA